MMERSVVSSAAGGEIASLTVEFRARLITRMLSVPIRSKTYKQIGSSHDGEQGSSSAGCCHGGRGFLAVGSVRFDRCDPSPDPCHKFTASPRIFAAMLPSIPAAESADMGDSSAADSDKRQ